jgi:hypothetical protein
LNGGALSPNGLKKILHQKEKRTHKNKKHETTMAAPSQTLSILHLLDGYHFMT